MLIEYIFLESLEVHTGLVLIFKGFIRGRVKALHSSQSLHLRSGPGSSMLDITIIQMVRTERNIRAVLPC